MPKQTKLTKKQAGSFRDKRTEEEKLEDYIRARAAVRGIPVEEYRALMAER